MDILTSLEVRWFLADNAVVLAPLRQWFAQVSPEPRRCDEYLRTGRDDVGFKARVIENEPIKLETKYRLESLGVLELAPRVTGQVERWQKLSLSLHDPELKEQGAWRAVEKTRWLRKFAFDSGVATEVSGKARLAAGCGLELTELRWRDAAGAEARVEWTLALEAFGADAPLLEVLRGALRAALAAGLSLELGGQGSMGYAEWLQRS